MIYPNFSAGRSFAFKEYHVSAATGHLYAYREPGPYRTLFKALGFELVCDTRGFYYFVPDTAVAAAQVNKTAQRLALFTFIIVSPTRAVTIAVLDGGPR